MHQIQRIGNYQVQTSTMPGCRIYTLYEILAEDGKTVAGQLISRPSQDDCANAIRAFHNKAAQEAEKKRLKKARARKARDSWLHKNTQSNNQAHHGNGKPWAEAETRLIIENPEITAPEMVEIFAEQGFQRSAASIQTQRVKHGIKWARKRNAEVLA